MPQPPKANTHLARAYQGHVPVNTPPAASTTYFQRYLNINSKRGAKGVATNSCPSASSRRQSTALPRTWSRSRGSRRWLKAKVGRYARYTRTLKLAPAISRASRHRAHPGVPRGRVKPLIRKRPHNTAPGRKRPLSAY